MTNILPKKSLRDLKPYRPAVAENKNEDVIRLSVNEGALGPSPKVQKAIQEWSKQKHLFHRYPDQIDHNLIYEISRLPSLYFCLFNGFLVSLFSCKYYSVFYFCLA